MSALAFQQAPAMQKKYQETPTYVYIKCLFCSLRLHLFDHKCCGGESIIYIFGLLHELPVFNS